MLTYLRSRRGIFTVLAAAMLSIVTVWYILPWCTPLPQRLMRPMPVSPRFLSSDGKPLRQLLSTEGQRVGEPVRYEDLPEALIHATLAAEDRRFFSHGGVDLVATGRAIW